MKRCAICDYLEGHGADWLGLGADKRKVVWRHTHQEYQCETCFTQIREAKAEQDVKDAIKILEQPVASEDFDKVSEVPSSLPGLPF